MKTVTTSATTQFGQIDIVQKQSYSGEDWWEWSLELNATKEVLDSIERVVYRLHPTFANPVREVTDRGTKFKLETGGWGIFTVHVRVKFRGGDEAKLKHALELNYPDGTATTQ